MVNSPAVSYSLSCSKHKLVLVVDYEELVVNIHKQSIIPRSLFCKNKETFNQDVIFLEKIRFISKVKH